MDLSVIVPSRNEMFLARTIQDIVEKREAETEVIALLDGSPADPPVPQYPNVNIIYVNKSIGQRAGADMAVRLSKAKYIMKVDAHCSFDKGFDRKMIDGFKSVGDNVTMVPIMKNLHAFDWKCYKCGWKKYQGPTPEVCPDCGRKDRIRRKMVWYGKDRPNSTSYSFDSEPHFQYFGEYTKRPEYIDGKKKGFTESMSLQGSCFMTTREKYWELKLGGEEFGNWGNQGLQIACATWLTGGRVVVNHNTWYAHMFRTQGGDFGFPYPLSGKDTQQTKKKVWEFFFSGWDKQIYPVSWLIERFWPVPGWSEADLASLKEQEAKIKAPVKTQ